MLIILLVSDTNIEVGESVSTAIPTVGQGNRSDSLAGLQVHPPPWIIVSMLSMSAVEVMGTGVTCNPEGEGKQS